MKRKTFFFIVFAFGCISFFNILNAQTWSPAWRLTYNSGGSGDPAIATDTGNNIHVVWIDDSPGNYEIFYKSSTDGGSSWSPARRLTYSSGDSGSLGIATDTGNNIHVVWNDDSPGKNERS